jgi:hypothetical protein
MKIHGHTYAVKATYNTPGPASGEAPDEVFFGPWKKKVDAQAFAERLLADDSDTEEYAETAEVVCINTISPKGGKK